MSTMQATADVVRPAIRALEAAAPVSDLLLRLWVAKIFFQSGLTKIASMDSTILLFKYEYEVPLLSPEVAAYAGTFAELTLPVLLAVGIAGRLGAIGLFVFNIVAVISYPGLNEVGREDHLVWGLMLLVAVLRGPGKLSVDHFLRRRYMP